MYGIALDDVYARRVSFRRLAVLVDALPPGSAVWEALGDDRAWSDADHMLQQISYRTALRLWQASGDSNATKPDPYPTPGQRRAYAAQRATKASAAARRSARHKARQQARKPAQGG